MHSAKYEFDRNLEITQTMSKTYESSLALSNIHNLEVQKIREKMALMHMNYKPQEDEIKKLKSEKGHVQK